MLVNHSGLSREAARCFAALSMTRLDLSVGEELSRSFEPCLSNYTSFIAASLPGECIR